MLLYSVVTIHSQTYELIDVVDWSTQSDGSRIGTSNLGNTWSSFAKTNCDNTGFFGVRNGAFVIEDWEGTCGCPCFAGDTEGKCGANDNNIIIPAVVALGYCQVRVSFTVTATGTLECGSNDDKTPGQAFAGCLPTLLAPDWGGTDFMNINVTSSEGESFDYSICGTKNAGQIVASFSTLESSVISLLITGGTQETGETYSIGNIRIEGVRRQIQDLNATVITATRDTLCMGTGLPLILQASADPTFLYQWTGPQGFASSLPSPRIDNITTANSGVYKLTVVDGNSCAITDEVRVTILAANDPKCSQKPVFSYFGVLCSDQVLSNTSDNGIKGTWSPGVQLSQFAGQSLLFEFSPDDPNIQKVSYNLKIDDISRLPNFGLQPDPVPIFCNGSSQSYDLIKIFKLDTSLFLRMNGANEVFTFIPNNDYLNNYIPQLSNMNFNGISTGERNFFIEALSDCGEKEQKQFKFIISGDIEPLRIDTSICDGGFFEFAGLKITRDTVLSDGLCDSSIIIKIMVKPKGVMGPGRFFPGSVVSAACNDVYYFYDTIIGNQYIGFVKSESTTPPPYGPNYFAIFKKDHVGQFTLPFPAGNGCDSIANIAIRIGASFTQTFQFDLCANKDTLVQLPNGQSYLMNIGIPFRRINAGGGACNFYDIIANILPVQVDSIKRTFCADQDTLIEGVLFNKANPKGVVFLEQGTNGCNASKVVDITFIDPLRDTIDVRLCPGETISAGGQIFGSATNYKEILLSRQASTLCDSIVVVNVKMINPITKEVNDTLCKEDNFTLLGEIFDINKRSGIVRLPSALGCDSIIYLVNLDFHQVADTVLSPILCFGETLNLTAFGKTVTASTLSQDFEITTADGCKRKVSIRATMNNEIKSSRSEFICFGESFQLGTQTLTQSGTYTEKFKAGNGCDSTVTLTLAVGQEIKTTKSEFICFGSSYQLGTKTLNQSGSFTEIFKAANGCDSTVTVNLTVGQELKSKHSEFICFGETLQLGAQTLSQSGSYSEVFKAGNGCDSTVTVDLTVGQQLVSSRTEFICFGQSFKLGSQTLTQSGNYTEVFKAGNGCDSTVSLTLTVANDLRSSIKETICFGSNYLFGTQALNTSGIYVEVFTAGNGCDSSVTLDLTVIEKYEITLNKTICFGESFSVGSATYSSSGTYSNALKTAIGCDSLVILNLIVSPKLQTNNPRVSLCRGESYSIGSSVYTETGIYIDTLKSKDGCDSIVRTDLLILEHSIKDLNITICTGTSFTVGNKVYSNAGVYVDTLTASNGCDSIIRLTLSVGDKFIYPVNETICFGDNYRVGTSTYNKSGIYSDTLISTAGCDSIINLTLTVRAFSESKLFETICFGESYLIEGNSYSASGKYIINTTNANGCDSIIELNLIALTEKKTSLNRTICFGESIQVGNSKYNTSGTYTDVIISPSGCDSTVTLLLTVLPEAETSLKHTICEGESVGVGSQTFTTTGIHKVVLKNANGCDSTVTLDLTVIGKITKSVDVTLCFGQSHNFDGKTLSTSGTYKDTLKTSLGCDSIVTLNLLILPQLALEIGTIFGSCEGVANGSFSIEKITGAAPLFQLYINGTKRNDITSLPVKFDQLAAGKYDIRIIDKNGCEATTSVTIASDRGDLLDILVNVVDPLGMFELDLDYSGTIGKIEWENTPGLSCYDCPDPIADIEETTSYTVKVTDVDGCISIESVILKVDNIGNIYIPNAMVTNSPVGNNYFYVMGEDGEDALYDMIIYDRWGNKAFEVYGAQVNNPDYAWTGRFNNTILNSAVFTYHVQIYKANGAHKEMTGTVTVVR